MSEWSLEREDETVSMKPASRSGGDRGQGSDLPRGTVTLLLADIEKSVRLWEQHADGMIETARRLDAMVDSLAADHGGVRPVEQGEGDSFVLAFARTAAAARCAIDLQQKIADEPWPDGVRLKVRMALHTGDVELRDEGYYAGPTVNRCARIRALAHGGQTLLSQTTADLVLDHLPDGVSVVDLGSVELRDMARPERIYQLVHPDLPADFAPLAATAPLENLPLQTTTFVGREIEKAEVRSLLETSRVVTLTGAGGSGKTRLALEVAREVVGWAPHGTWWVDLAGIAQPELVAVEVARTLGVTTTARETVSDGVIQHLRDRGVLLILDNCEHVIAACAELVASVAQQCPAVAIIATSREGLHVEGESIFPVPPLSLPDEDEGARPSDAVQLFLERARQVRPNFTLSAATVPAVVEICRRLDGIPLAIELAAARVRMLAPAQIAEALSDRFRLLTGGPRTAMPRQRTLDASVEWSYRLLSPAQQLVFSRLSVFAGTFSLDAAEQVCADESLEPVEVLDVLAGLVDRSLVQVEASSGEARYRLLESIRVYARDRLAELDDPARVRDRHLAFFADIAKEAQGRLAVAFAPALAWLTPDLDNIRAAMDWAGACDRPATVIDIVGPLTPFWAVRGLYREMHDRLAAAVTAEGIGATARGRGLVAAAMFAVLDNDYAAGYQLASSAMTFEDDSDPGMWAQARAYRAWSGFLSGTGTTAEVWADVDRALALAAGQPDPVVSGRVGVFTGTLRILGRSITEGKAELQQVLELARRGPAADHPLVTVPLHFFLAIAWSWDGLVAEARRHYEEVLRLGQPIGYHYFVSLALVHLALIDVAEGNPCSARRRLGEARQFTLRVARGQILTGEALLAHEEGRPDEAREKLDAAIEVQRDPFFAWFVAICESFAGSIALTSGDAFSARQYFDAARSHSADPFYPGPFAQASTGLAWLALDDDDLEQAGMLGYQAVETLADYGDRMNLPAALTVLSAVAAANGGLDRAARILGAVDRLTRDLGLAGAIYRFHDDLRARTAMSVRPQLGEVQFDACFVEGSALSPEEAVAYVLRGRGERRRPTSGWQSLTPTETDVVRLVAEGCSNAQIADRLFVSPNTVKTHLAHVYAKLGLSSRAELAAAAARRER